MTRIISRGLLTGNLAEQRLRLGSLSLMFSGVAILLYIVWNGVGDESWSRFGLDDALLVGLALGNAVTAFALNRASSRIAVSERERAAAQKMADDHRLWLQAVMQQAPIGLAVVQAQTTRLKFANHRYFQILSSNDLDSHHTLKVFDKLGHACPPEAWPSARVLRTGRASWGEEFQVEKGDGKRIWLSVNCVPIVDTGGQVAAALIAFNDITLQREVQELRTRTIQGVLHAQEAERLRIARELHDDLGQHLTALSIALKSFEKAGAQVDPAAIRNVRSTVERMNMQLHHLIKDLRPLILDDLGLVRAIEDLVSTWETRLNIRIDSKLADLDDALPDGFEIVIYRVVQEAFTNIAKHARASTASIRSLKTEGGLSLFVEDNGVGFSMAANAIHAPDSAFGLAGMNERVEGIGGHLTIDTTPGAGTRIVVSFPFNRGSLNGSASPSHLAGR